MNKIPYIICSIMVVLMGACTKDPMPDLKETYGYTQAQPFGTFIAKKVIEHIFPGKKIKISNRPFSKMYSSSADTNAIYFCISRNLFVQEEDARAMMNFVYSGNTLFISASNIDTLLLRKLLSSEMRSDAILDMVQPVFLPTTVSLAGDVNQGKNNFSYYYKPFANFFPEINARYSKVISYNNAKKPNGIIFFLGKGRFILHCDPRAFSNYFLLSNNNYEYLQQLLQVTGASPGKIYWDDFYRTHDVHPQADGRFSTFGEIMKYPALAGAFWIFIFLLGLYVLFNSKRKQKIIPEIKPNENSSIAFTQTIARLYMQQKDNKNIADKMITYFNEYVRNNYFLTVNATNTDFISALSRKSGVSFEQTKDLFNAIDEVNNSINMNDQELLLLNEHFQNFYKKGTNGRKHF